MNGPDYGRAFALWREAAGAEWRAYTRHAFVEGLRDGSLPRAAFLHYLAQDYVFLVHFARAWALAVAKAETLDEMRVAAGTVDALVSHEMRLHVETCAAEGLSEAALFATEERPENLAYTRYAGERGFTEKQFRETAAEVAGVDLAEWFQTTLSSTKELDYQEALDWFGLRFAPAEGKETETAWRVETRPDATPAQKARLTAWLGHPARAAPAPRPAGQRRPQAEASEEGSGRSSRRRRERSAGLMWRGGGPGDLPSEIAGDFLAQPGARGEPIGGGPAGARRVPAARASATGTRSVRRSGATTARPRSRASARAPGARRAKPREPPCPWRRRRRGPGSPCRRRSAESQSSRRRRPRRR